MTIALLDTENADRDLTSQVVVLTHTITEGPSKLQVKVDLGDGVKDLDGTGGDFELQIEVNGRVWDGGVQTKAIGTEIETFIESQQFTANEGDEIIAKVKSPNAGDSDVDVTAYLYDMNKTVTDGLSNIANVGGATNTPATSNSVVNTGTVIAGTYASTKALDGSYWQIEDDAGEIDVDVEFFVGNNGSPIEVVLTGRLAGLGDDLNISAYDRVAEDFLPVDVMIGKNSPADEVLTFVLYNTMIGTGADAGKVTLKLSNTGLSSSDLYIDRIYCSYTTLFSAVGYENAAVWINTLTGEEGTVVDINGVGDLPCKTIADALTIAAAKGLARFEVAPGSVITLPSSIAGLVFFGDHWTLNLNGQNCSDAVIHGATISGVATGANLIHFENCCVDAVSLPPSQFHVCGLRATITATAPGDFFMERCYSEIAGTATPSFDFGAAVGNSNVNFRNYSGGIELKNMGQNGDDTMSLEGRGQYIINANCQDGLLVVRGLFSPTDNAEERVDVIEIARFGTDQEMTLTEATLTAIANAIRDSKWTAGGVATVGFITRCINSMAKGNFYRTGNEYRFYDDDDTPGDEDGTLLFTLTVTEDGERRGS